VLVGVALRSVLALVLAGAALAKVAGGPSGRAALSTWGLRADRSQRVGMAALVAVESVLAITLAAGVAGAAEAAAVVLWAFAAALGLQLLRRRSGMPCACFGARSRIGVGAFARTAVLAAAATAVPLVPDVRPSLQVWLAAGLALALAGVVALAVGLLALAREVGELRLSLGPQSALALDDEGPELGGATPLRAHFPATFEHGLAIFGSARCPVCQALEPALAFLEREPGLSIRRFDEDEHPLLWQELRIPGAPYAVVLDGDGVARAKGTFNTLLQLEGVLAAAERAPQEPLLV
jgi:hypothetical protein